jgi:hypothetical protein
VTFPQQVAFAAVEHVLEIERRKRKGAGLTLGRKAAALTSALLREVQAAVLKDGGAA